MPILAAFQDFPDEASIIGLMLAGYADLEIVLMNCVKAVRGDLDLALKAMFRGRGNAQRIDIADALARQPYHVLGVGAAFERAVGAVRHCLRIRNLYAHCTWWDDNSGQLAFANLEELAKENAVIKDLHGLTVDHVSMPHLQAQLSYFEYTYNVLIGVIQAGNKSAGRPVYPGIVVPPDVVRPPIYLRSKAHSNSGKNF